MCVLCVCVYCVCVCVGGVCVCVCVLGVCVCACARTRAVYYQIRNTKQLMTLIFLQICVFYIG